VVEVEEEEEEEEEGEEAGLSFYLQQKGDCGKFGWSHC